MRRGGGRLVSPRTVANDGGMDMPLVQCGDANYAQSSPESSPRDPALGGSVAAGANTDSPSKRGFKVPQVGLLNKLGSGMLGKGGLTKESVRDWLLQADEDDYQWVLNSVLPDRLYVERANSEPIQEENTPQLSARKMSLPGMEAAHDVFPVVQFATFEYFVDEDQEEVVIDVIRIGDLAFRSEVEYQTKEVTGKAAESHVPQEGVLTFHPGDYSKEIRVSLVPNETWDATVDFGVMLRDAGLVNATLEEHFREVNIKVLNNDTFPTNKYADALTSHDMDEVPEWGLLLEYLKMNTQDQRVWWGTLKMMVLSLFHNLDYCMGLFLNVWLVEGVLKGGEGGSEGYDILALIVVLGVAPNVFLHFFDYQELSWGVSGSSRFTLQANLLRHFLNLEESSRGKATSGDLIMGINRDAPAIVTEGYMRIISLADPIGKLGASAVYQMTVPFIFDMDIDVKGCLPLVMLPIGLLVFLMVRRQKISESLHNVHETQNALTEEVGQIQNNLPLLVEYNMRCSVMGHFEEQIKKTGRASRESNQVTLNNIYFAMWLEILLVAAYMLFAGRAVMEGALGLGFFLTNIKMFHSIGQAWRAIYMTMLDVHGILPGLRRIAYLLNLETDLYARKEQFDANNSKTRELRKELRRLRDTDLTESLSNTEVDLLPITLKVARDRQTRRRELNLNGHLEVRQGHLVYFVGGRAQGKSTLLRVLGGVLLPTQVRGHKIRCFVPSHLRSVHVGFEPYFLKGTLYENICFGGSPDDPIYDFKRVVKVCQNIGIPKHIINKLKEKELPPGFLSHSEKHLISLARALVANPELLCVHKPIAIYDEIHAKLVLGTLRKYVDQRGIEVEASKFHLRRPRTAICSIQGSFALEIQEKHPEHGIFADKIYNIGSHGIEDVQPKEALHTLRRFSFAEKHGVAMPGQGPTGQGPPAMRQSHTERANACGFDLEDSPASPVSSPEKPASPHGGRSATCPALA